jgi:restriction system protein
VDDLSEMLPSGRQTVFSNIVGWAKTYLKKAGLIDSPARALIVITDAGKKVLQENPEKIDSKYLEKFPSFKNFSSASSSDESDIEKSSSGKATDLTPDDQLEDAYKQINANLASDLLSEIMKITPYTFEKLVVDLLSKMGYGTVAYGSHATTASGDDGIDGVIMEDKLGFSLIYMQAKQWTQDRVVGQPEIQSFVGAIAGKHGDGLFVTTTRFSQKAKDYAHTHHIILIDGERLANLMIEFNFCVSVRKTFEIKDIDTDAMNEYQEE